MPELAGTISTAAMGLLGAGLWNVAASNIINLLLFGSAVLFFRQQRELINIRFLDEIGFAVGSILIPLLLVIGGGASRSVWTAIGLGVFFVFYIVLDRYLNVVHGRDASTAPNREHTAKSDDEETLNPSSKKTHTAASNTKTPAPIKRTTVVFPVVMIVLGLATVVVLGRFLGSSAESVVRKLGIPQWGVGWIMGVLTSLPELTSFFAIYASAKRKGHLAGDADTQEATDNLAASNMSNLGLIYPLGIIIFILAGYG
jgi:Ca2+/Na+ antiporter